MQDAGTSKAVAQPPGSSGKSGLSDAGRWSLSQGRQDLLGDTATILYSGISKVGIHMGQGALELTAETGEPLGSDALEPAEGGIFGIRACEAPTLSPEGLGRATQI